MVIIPLCVILMAFFYPKMVFPDTLPEITLSTQEETRMNPGYWVPSGPPGTGGSMYVGGGFSQTTKNYFSVENGPQEEKVDYFGENLAEYLKPVPEAFSIMDSYRTQKLTGIGMIVSGLAITLVSLSMTEKGSDGPPSGVYVGLGVCVCSWIPFLISRGKIEESVHVYEQHRTAQGE